MGPGAEKLSSQAEQLRRQQGLLRALKMRQLKRKVGGGQQPCSTPHGRLQRALDA